ncbi:unnamed protein product [Linum trigynum]|uniref:Uncharacterized protein n=1 Tax=Linum trigynum TaxID=586398 RepID=A0AAV2EYL0_9ROSI
MKPSTMSTSNGALCKSIVISGLALFMLYTVWSNHANNNYTAADLLLTDLQLKWPTSPFTTTSSPNNISTNVVPPTDISHIGFIVVSSLATWKHRKPYTESWWRPNSTRGYVFLDKEPTTAEFLPWLVTSPPWRVNEDITKLRVYPQLVNPVEVRIMRSILDMYRVGDSGLRWFVMADDDTLIFVDNLVEVLGKYDHTEYHYIGMNSECVKSNADFSFDMGFGGAGYALSYALVEVLAPKLDACIERYPYLYVSDHLAQSCLADIGISLTIEKGIHQIDLHGDISGLLSSHPQSPALTLHHFDAVEPIFPSMDRYEAARHIMKPGNVVADQSRMLQQTICYQRVKNFSFSVSWGYSVHIYETIIPRSILRKPLETFKPWNNHVKYPSFMFNTRRVTNNPCEAPHVFFFQSIELVPPSSNDHRAVVATIYGRASARVLPPCSVSGHNHSADSVSTIRVLSPATVHKMPGVIECCGVEYEDGADIAEIKIRSCTKDEVIA